MALDFTKLTHAVKSVADLAASHASVSALAADAKALAKSVEDKVRAEFDALEAAAQSELDSITAALEAALAQPSSQPLTTAEAVGVTAVAVALSGDAPVSPTQPAVATPVSIDPAPPVAVGVAPLPPVAPVGVAPAPAPAVAPAPAAPQTVEEYNAMRAAGLIQ